MVLHCPLRVERARRQRSRLGEDDEKLRDTQPALAEQSALPRKILATRGDPPEAQH